MVVRGPMNMVLDHDEVCDVCGKSMHSRDAVFVGRVNGHVIHACSKACFDACVSKGMSSEQDIKDSEIR